MVRIRKQNSIHVATGDALGPLSGPETLISTTVRF